LSKNSFFSRRFHHLLLCSRDDFKTQVPVKGSVQRKLRWVENGVNRSVGASDCGAGFSFVIIFGFPLGFTIILFSVSTAQIIGEFWKNR
jgi:hypothetical protein